MEPAIHSRKEYEEWDLWPDPDKLTKKTYKFYKKMVDLYGDKMCICGQGAVYDVFESLKISIGFGRLAMWVGKERDLVKYFVEKTDEIMRKSAMAMKDAAHALENTSNVSILEIKSKFGDEITLIGGVEIQVDSPA